MTEAYETNWMSTVGANIDSVEREISQKVGVRYAVALASGTAALHLAVKLAGERLYGMAKPYEGTDFAEMVRERTGIPFSPYFPAAKAAWILRHEARAATLAGQKRLCLGTVDAWLLFRLTLRSLFRA